MRQIRLRRLGLALMAGALVLPAAPALAQADPSTTLSNSLKTLATSPRDLNALMAAGRASLELGDLQSAAGFFGRADEAYPNSPLPKIGMGGALAMTGDATGALAQFQKAQSLGAPQAMLGVDRGLAYDLLGDQARAQLDYKAAMGGPNADEARRRLALSLAISKDIRGAATALEPLLARRDPAALRTNAFVLALAGDREGARRTIDAAMPGAGARFEPFFKMLPVLRPAEKAAAVHLGEFPSDAAQRYASAEPVPISPVVSVGNSAPGRIDAPKRGVKVTPPVTAKAKPPKAEKPVRVAEAPRRAERMANEPSTTFAMMRAATDPGRYASSSRRKPETQAATTTKDAPADPEPRPAFSLPSQGGDDLAPLPGAAEPVVPVSAGALNDDGEPLVAANDVPPAPTPKLEMAVPPRPTPKVERVALATKPKVDAAKLAADKKAKDAADKKAKELAEKKAKDAAATKIGVSGTYWVQLAGGSNPERMGAEYKRITGKKSALFSGKPGYVTSGKDYFRLLVGPFKTTGEAHDYVTKLDKAGVDSFMWTRNPAQIRIEKIPS